MTETHNAPKVKRYAKLTKATAYPVIERYFASGELPSTFYRREGLTEHQFYKWRKYYLQDHPSLASRLGLSEPPSRSRKRLSKTKGKDPDKALITSEEIGFGRVMPVSPDRRYMHSASSAGVWEIEFPNGVRLRIGSQTPLERIGALISIVGI